MINLSGISWATDILYGKRPIPTYPSPDKESKGFQDILDKAIEEGRAYEKEKGNDENKDESNRLEHTGVAAACFGLPETTFCFRCLYDISAGNEESYLIGERKESWIYSF